MVGGYDNNRQRGGAGRRASVDSRTVARQLESSEEAEVLGVMDDVRGFLKRKDGQLPKYVQRKDLVQELVKGATNERMMKERRAEAIDLAWKLIDRSKSKKEVTRCLEVSLPSMVSLLGSEIPLVRQASLRFLQESVGDSSEGDKMLVEAISRQGVANRDHATSREAMSILPGLFTKYIKDVDLSPIVVSLYDQLEVSHRKEAAFAALVRHREMLGERRFEEFSEDASLPGKNMFDRIQRNNMEESELLKRRPREGVSFGMIPNAILNRITDKSNRQERGDGAQMLRRELTRGSRHDLDLLVPYMASFLKFLGAVMTDSNPKVILHCLECHGLLMSHLPSTMRAHTEAMVDNLMEVSLDSKPQVKAELYRVMREVMVCGGPMRVTKLLMEDLDHKNPKMREDILIYIVYALLTFPSTDFDLDVLIKNVVPALSDQKRRVRQGALECMAMISSCLGPKRSSVIYRAIDDADNDDSIGAEEEIGVKISSSYDSADDVSAAVQCRLSRRQLPRITRDGFVEYGLQVTPPHPAQGRRGGRGGLGLSSSQSEGADVEWILKGTGNLSRGTTSSSADVGGGRRNDLGGSTLSLQSIRSGASSDMRGRYDRSNSFQAEPKGFGRHSRIPSIKGSSRSSRRTQSESPNRRNYDDSNGGPELLRHQSEPDDRNNMFKVVPPTRGGDGSSNNRRQSHAIDDGPEDEEIKNRWRNKEDLISLLSAGERKERQGAYGTMTRSESLLNLRAAAATPPSRRRKNDLPQLGEEEEEEERSSGTGRGGRNDNGDYDTHNNDKNGGEVGFRKVSLAQLGLAKSAKKNRLFDDEEGLNDDEAPGAFRRPESAYRLAKRDLKSERWETEVDGLDALVRLVRYHPDLIIDDLKYVVGAVLHECKNLRSQVTRAAIQAMVQLLEHVGRDMEELKVMDEVADTLFTKTADTNRFIRKDSLTALDALAERLSVYRSVQLISYIGCDHKNTVARTTSAALLAAIAEKLGQDRLMRRRERATLETLIKSGARLLQNGSLDTRTEAKRIFKVIMEHQEFQDALEDAIRSKQDLERARKDISAIKKTK